MNPLVRAQPAGRVLRIELDRPARRNALSRSMLHQLHAALTAPSVLDHVGVVLTGQGCFSAGADIAELSGTADDVGFDDEVSAVADALATSPRPVVAAVEGPCLGAACDLALACDLRVAGRSAVFGIPAVRLGILYNPSALRRMHRAVGGPALRRLLLGGRVPAEDARGLGIVAEVVADGAAADAAVALLAALPDGSEDAVAATRALLADLDAGVGVAPEAERTRRDLLDSPARRSLLGAAQHRHGRPHATTPDSPTSQGAQR